MAALQHSKIVCGLGSKLTAFKGSESFAPSESIGALLRYPHGVYFQIDLAQYLAHAGATM
jgi:hypothetical protein